jgi:seryl-tRNA synthetase
MTSLERLWNFTMWEVIFVGKAERVLDGIKQSVQMASELFQEIGLAFHVENANDPFFLEEFAIQSAYQQAYDLKHEFRAKLPFKGTTLAIGSRNYHQDFFGRRAEISLPDNKPVHTGCVGFGYERLAFAFVAQYGPDPSNWPAIVRENIPKYI